MKKRGRKKKQVKADAESLHVRFADEAVCIGPAASSESYLKIPNIIAAAEITNSDAIHPGYGFLSENSNFSKICAENGIKFIGASPQMIDGMGDKAAAKETMKKAGVPTIPGSKGLIKDYTECKKLASDIGYPISNAISLHSLKSLIKPLDPGIVGTPAFSIVDFAAALSPIPSIIFGEAPINLIPFSAHIFEKLEFSARNPYPGCTASEFVISAAAIIFGIFR